MKGSRVMPASRARLLEPLGWGGLFALAHSQLPLYSGNQNTYLLHAVARAEPSGLARDWLVRTLDPFPLFTALSVALIRIAPSALHVAYALVLVAYGAALWLLVRSAAPGSGWPGRAAAMSLLVLLHSMQMSFLASGFHEPWTPGFWTGGLADQVALGPVWQPSVFGACLVAAVALAARGRYAAAAACAVAAQTVHATYLLGAASLMAGLAWAVWREERDPRRALRLLAASGAAMLALTAFAYLRFRSGDPQAARLAQHILFAERVPGHADPAVWWTAPAGLKIGLMAAGLACAWKGPLRRVLLPPLLLGAVLSLAAAGLRDPFLCLLFPWRVSVWLVPVALALSAGRLAEFLGRRRPGRAALAVLAVAGACASLLVAAQGVLGFRHMRTARDPRYEEALAAVRARLPAGGVLLIPPHLEEFRLDARVPVWIDRKSHPYRDSDILEWKARLDAAYAWYAGQPGELEKLDPAGEVAWVLLDSRTGDAPLPENAQSVFRNAEYRLVRWERGPP